VFPQRTQNIQRNDVSTGQRTDQQTKHISGNLMITYLIDRIINFSLQVIGWVVTSGFMDVAMDTFHTSVLSHVLSLRLITGSQTQQLPPPCSPFFYSKVILHSPIVCDWLSSNRSEVKIVLATVDIMLPPPPTCGGLYRLV
jgi:hypothetical protein